MRHIQFRQSGNGVFMGTRYQKGNGFFGRMIKNAILPFLKYIGKQGIKTAVAIGGEAVRDPSNFKEIAKSKLKEVGMEAIDDGAQRIKKFVQTGKGIKRKSDITETRATKKRRIVKKKTSKALPVNKKSIKGKKSQKFPFLKKNGAHTH